MRLPLPAPKWRYARRSLDVVAAIVGAGFLAVSWVLALADDVSAVEEDTFRFVNEWPDWLELPLWPVMQAGAVAIVPLGALAVWVLWRRARPALSLLAAGMAAWLLAKVVKSLVERGRPGDLIDSVIQRPEWTGLGFVSGHAATAFALATVASPYLSRLWKAVVWALATATIVLRMYTGAHLGLDIVGGAGLGIALGATVHLILGAPAKADDG